jgi:DNA-binding LacI/PurR family transcriptional regulator
VSDAKIKNMEEFAAISGISRPTVSKYFHDPDSVRASTRERIEKALQEHDYRPNIYAVNQNRKLTKNIGIVVPYLADPFFAELARNVEQRCIDAGFRPTLYSAHGNSSVEIEILESLRVLKPAGVLMAPLGRSSDRGAVEKFCADVPTVLFDSELPDLGVPFIGSDNAQFARLIVDYLSRTGEPPCFLEMKHPANPNANKRRQGYIKAVEALGLTPHVVSLEGEGWSIEEIARVGGAKAIAEGAFATRSVLCSNDRLAIGFLVACYENNLSVGIGNDAAIRVSGMDDHPFSRFTCPPLTTVAQDYDSISRHAVEALFGAIEGIENTQNRVLFEGKLIMRQSA